MMDNVYQHLQIGGNAFQLQFSSYLINSKIKLAVQPLVSELFSHVESLLGHPFVCRSALEF